ncbi:NADP-dependent oxidoreductase domain-containing protein, partial [Russula earlei]
GKIRYYGISSIRPNVIREYVHRSNMVSVMMQYSLTDRRPEETCLPLLQEHNIGVLARGSLAQGLLVDKPPKPYLQYSPEDIQRAAEAVKAVSGPERSATQTALQFALSHPAITSAIVGVRTRAQLAEAVQSVGAPAVTGEELFDLQQVLPANRYQEHR